MQLRRIAQDPEYESEEEYPLDEIPPHPGVWRIDLIEPDIPIRFEWELRPLPTIVSSRRI